MDTLLWNKQHRDRLYYSRFEFRASFQLRGIARTRFARDYAEYYEKYQEILDEQQRFKVRAITLPSWYATLPDAFELQDIERFINWRNKSQGLVTVRLEHDRCSVFSNDPDKLEELRNILYLKTPVFTQVTGMVTDPEVMTLSKPQHQFRTFLRETKMTAETISELNDFVDRYTASRTIMPSQAFFKWLNLNPASRNYWRGQRTRSDYYFEHDDEGIVLIFAIVCPDLLRKTYRLEPR